DGMPLLTLQTTTLPAVGAPGALPNDATSSSTPSPSRSTGYSERTVAPDGAAPASTGTGVIASVLVEAHGSSIAACGGDARSIAITPSWCGAVGHATYAALSAHTPDAPVVRQSARPLTTAPSTRTAASRPLPVPATRNARVSAGAVPITRRSGLSAPT